MKLINPSVENWHDGCDKYTLEEVWSHITKCCRVCYQSEPKDNKESGEGFVKRVILRGNSIDDIGINRDLQLKLHLSTLEHGTIYLKYSHYPYVKNMFIGNKYSKIRYDEQGNVYVTTNMRVIIENNLYSTLEYMCPPTKYHELRTTFSIITDIGIARELDRHRSHSISEESTRFCGYNKDRFNNELTFIKPEWLDIPCGSYNEKQYDNENYYTDYSPEYSFMIHLFTAEATYNRLTKDDWKPQQAREVLPLCTKVQTIHTAYNSDWEEFIKLRAKDCSGPVHPNMKVVATLIKDNLYGANC